MKNRIISSILLLLIFVPFIMKGGIFFAGLILVVGLLAFHELFDLKLKTRKLCTISGPSFASDMAKDELIGLSLATTNKTTKDVVIKALASDTLKIRPTNDFLGVELCGTLKNITKKCLDLFLETYHH